MRFLKRQLAKMVQDAPEFTPTQAAALRAPATPEARQLLAVVPCLERIPLDEEIRPFMPLVARMLQEVALECEGHGPEPGTAPQRRAEVAAFLEELRKALLLLP